MRCYRCGVLMSADTDTCPGCGFFLQSPVEIQMYEGMTDIRIYDNAKDILWSGDGNDTAYIDAPERRNIRICWGCNSEIWLSLKNGEAYRFDRFSQMGKSRDYARLVKIRTISKRKN